MFQFEKCISVLVVAAITIFYRPGSANSGSSRERYFVISLENDNKDGYNRGSLHGQSKRGIEDLQGITGLIKIIQTINGNLEQLPSEFEQHRRKFVKVEDDGNPFNNIDSSIGNKRHIQSEFGQSNCGIQLSRNHFTGYGNNEQIRHEFLQPNNGGNPFNGGNQNIGGNLNGNIESIRGDYLQSNIDIGHIQGNVNLPSNGGNNEFLKPKPGFGNLQEGGNIFNHPLNIGGNNEEIRGEFWQPNAGFEGLQGGEYPANTDVNSPRNNEQIRGEVLQPIDDYRNVQDGGNFANSGQNIAVNNEQINSDLMPPGIGFGIIQGGRYPVNPSQHIDERNEQIRGELLQPSVGFGNPHGPSNSGATVGGINDQVGDEFSPPKVGFENLQGSGFNEQIKSEFSHYNAGYGNMQEGGNLAYIGGNVGANNEQLRSEYSLRNGDFGNVQGGGNLANSGEIKGGNNEKTGKEYLPPKDGFENVQVSGNFANAGGNNEQIRNEFLPSNAGFENIQGGGYFVNAGGNDEQMNAFLQVGGNFANAGGNNEQIRNDFFQERGYHYIPSVDVGINNGQNNGEFMSPTNFFGNIQGGENFQNSGGNLNENIGQIRGDLSQHNRGIENQIIANGSNRRYLEGLEEDEVGESFGSYKYGNISNENKEKLAEPTTKMGGSDFNVTTVASKSDELRENVTNSMTTKGGLGSVKNGINKALLIKTFLEGIVKSGVSEINENEKDESGTGTEIITTNSLENKQTESLASGVDSRAIIKPSEKVTNEGNTLQRGDIAASSMTQNKAGTNGTVNETGKTLVDVNIEGNTFA